AADVEPWHFLSEHGYDIIPKPIRELLRAKTDDVGIVQMPAMPRKGFSTVQATAKSFGTQEIRLVDRDSEPAQRTLTIRPAGRIEGRLVSEKPAWARGVKLWFHTSDQADEVHQAAGISEITTTDESGRFIVPVIAAGRLRIEVREVKGSPLLARLPDGLSVTAGETLTITLPLEPAVIARGTIRTEDTQRPVQGAEVSVRYGTWRQGEHVLSDADGRFQARVLPGNVYTQIISFPDEFARGYV